MNNNNTGNGINLENGLCKVGYTWFEHFGNNSQFNIIGAQLLYLWDWSLLGQEQGPYKEGM